MRKIALILVIVTMFSTCAFGMEIIEWKPLQVGESTATWAADIKIYIEGKEITFSDENGEYVAPVILENTTYLPVRSIGQVMGKEVAWDSAAKRVYLAERTTTTDFVSTAPTKFSNNINKSIVVKERPDVSVVINGVRKVFTLNGETVNPISYNGTTYLPLRAISVIMGKMVQWDSSARAVYLGMPPSNVIEKQQTMLNNYNGLVTKINNAGNEMQTAWKVFFAVSEEKQASAFKECVDEYKEFIIIGNTLSEYDTAKYNASFEMPLHKAVSDYYESTREHFYRVIQAASNYYFHGADLQTAKDIAYDSSNLSKAYNKLISDFNRLPGVKLN